MCPKKMLALDQTARRDIVMPGVQGAYHNLCSERANLLDGTRCSLLEAYAVDLMSC